MSKIPLETKTVLLNGIVVGEVVSTGDLEHDTEAVRQFLKNKGLHTEVSLFQGMFNQAVAFANTSALLREKRIEAQDLNGLADEKLATIWLIAGL